MDTSLREADYLKAWAAFAACATVGGFVAGLVVGVILGFSLRAAGASPETAKILCAIAGFIAGLPVSYFFFKMFVSKFLIARLTYTTAPSGIPPNA